MPGFALSILRVEILLSTFLLFFVLRVFRKWGVKCGLHLRLAVIYLLRAGQNGVHERGAVERD